VVLNVSLVFPPYVPQSLSFSPNIHHKKDNLKVSHATQRAKHRVLLQNKNFIKRIYHTKCTNIISFEFSKIPELHVEKVPQKFEKKIYVNPARRYPFLEIWRVYIVQNVRKQHKPIQLSIYVEMTALIARPLLHI